MPRLCPLTRKIANHFSIHPSRQKTLASMIFSILSSSNVQHQSLARYVDSPNPKAALRKVERFFSEQPYAQKNMPKPLLKFLDLKAILTYASIEPTGSLAKRTLII